MIGGSAPPPVLACPRRGAGAWLIWTARCASSRGRTACITSARGCAASKTRACASRPGCDLRLTSA